MASLTVNMTRLGIIRTLESMYDAEKKVDCYRVPVLRGGIWVNVLVTVERPREAIMLSYKWWRALGLGGVEF